MLGPLLFFYTFYDNRAMMFNYEEINCKTDDLFSTDCVYKQIINTIRLKYPIF